MFKRCFFILLGFCLCADVLATDLTQRDTLYLREPTEINGRLSPDWDTVLCWVTRLDGDIVAQPLMASDGKGRWSGKVTDISSWRGHYRAEYYGIYDDGDPATTDTFARFEAFSVLDTAAFQGLPAPVDSGMIARAVHFATTAVYGGSTGTMGKALVDAASCNPTGSNTVIVRLKRDSDSTAIIGATIEVKTNGTTYYIYDTDMDGKIQFLSDDDTLYVYARSHPIAFTFPETLFVDGNEDTTYYGTPFSPSAPPIDSVCIVYGWIKRSGVGIEGAKVKMWLPQFPVTFHGVIVDAINPVTVVTDSTGKFEFSDGWYPNSLLLPADTRYIFKVEWKGLKFDKKLEVPPQDSWEIELNL